MMRRFQCITTLLITFFPIWVLAQDAVPEKSPTSVSDPSADVVPTHDHSNDQTHDHSHGAPVSLIAPDRSSNADIQDDPAILEKMIGDLPEEIRGEAKEVWIHFNQVQSQLATAISDLRQIQIHYRNDFDRTPASIIRYREKRNEVWKLMRDQFDAALEMIRFLPSSEAGSYLVTMVQHCFDTDIYDKTIFEASARLLDLGQNFRFLYLSGARSAIVSGNFPGAKQIYEALKVEALEKADKALFFQLDTFEEQYKNEQKAIESSDAESLPQVRFETTMGEFTVELFPDSAPSASAHFLKLVRNGFYDGMDWSVVTENVLALTGDSSGDGRGNSGEFLVDEHERDDARHALRGSLIMAKIPVGEGKFIPNSGSSQFAIPFLPIASVSSEQTVFGRVIDGMDVVSRLRRVDPTKEKKKNEVTLPPDSIISTEIIREGDELPEPKYVDVDAEMKKAGYIRKKTPATP